MWYLYHFTNVLLYPIYVTFACIWYFFLLCIYTKFNFIMDNHILNKDSVSKVTSDLCYIYGDKFSQSKRIQTASTASFNNGSLRTFYKSVSCKCIKHDKNSMMLKQSLIRLEQKKDTDFHHHNALSTISELISELISVVGRK